MPFRGTSDIGASRTTYTYSYSGSCIIYGAKEVPKISGLHCNDAEKKCCIGRQRSKNWNDKASPLGELMYSTSLTHEQSEPSARAVVH